MMKLNKGEILSSQKIKEAISLLKEDFFEKGFHNVEIIYNSENSSILNHKKILFTINHGKKTKIKNVSIFSACVSTYISKTGFYKKYYKLCIERGVSQD